MSKLTVLMAIAAVASAALAIAASGATTTLTKAAVIKKGSVICRAAQQRVETAPQPRSQKPFAKNAPRGDRERAIAFLGVYAQALESVRIGLGKLSAPAPGNQLLDAFIAELGPTIAMFRVAHAEAIKGDYSSAMTHTTAAFSLFEKASMNTKRYGFPAGVCQAGS